MLGGKFSTNFGGPKVPRVSTTVPLGTPGPTWLLVIDFLQSEDMVFCDETYDKLCKFDSFDYDFARISCEYADPSDTGKR